VPAAVTTTAPAAVTTTAPVEIAAQGSGGNVLAALVSIFVPGLGQVLQGRLGDAVRIWLLLFAWTVALLIVMAITGAISPTIGAVFLLLGMVAGFGIYVLNIYDAATFDPRSSRKFLEFLSSKKPQTL
jgi:TM2 domain-containing membrane protein YozV